MEFPVKLDSTLDNNDILSPSDSNIYLVPCLADFTNNSFKPLINSHCQKISQSTTKNWSPSEDSVLLSIVSSRGPRAWALCAKELNSLCHQGIKIRQGWSCRDRWLNHLNPSIKLEGWTKEEDDLIIETQNSRGNRWSEIARMLENRTKEGVKERFRALQRRIIEKSGSDFNKIE